MQETLPKKLVYQIVLIALVGGLVGGAIFGRIQDSKPGKIIDTEVVQERYFVEESDSVNAIQKVVPAVVSIVATKDLQIFKQQPLDPFFFFEQDPFFRDFGFPIQPRRQQQQPQQQEPETKRQKIAGGTGFIIQKDGLALTNKHVVADTGADYSALTKDGKEYDVEVVSHDPVNDLAVIQLHEKTEDKSDRKTGEKKDFGSKPENMPVAELGDSTKLKVGQKVLAIGNARGEYENSVTAGIVSAVNREIQASDQAGSMNETLSGLIQTDAAINFGNSGGPLINLDGEVIGVNTAVDTQATGIGFAIPVSQVKPVLESVKKFGKIVRPVLGVIHTILNKEKAKELKLEGLEYGALITGDRAKKEFGVIPGSPAEKAGLKLDDVILEVDGEKVTEANTLQSMVQKHAPGDKLKLKVWRAGSTFEVIVTLDERKEEK
ncbi:trypsin-like peptidase domain-containing protein [Candidatus Peregrinibacteria bacterium]|nr:trypsin-like peptidase domain-containing protein [Candidatus Peregrinibacteria bacterium]